jgi:hypothetical protein
MTSRRERTLTGRTNSNQNTNANHYDRINNGVLRPSVIKPDTPLSQRRFEEPLSQRKGLGELDKREWHESARRAETPPEIPRRVGSITSGGVDGFGYVRPETKINPIKIANMAGKPAIFAPNHHLLSPGRPWWERDRFKIKPPPNTRRYYEKTSRPPSPVSSSFDYFVTLLFHFSFLYFFLFLYIICFHIAPLWFSSPCRSTSKRRKINRN